MVVVKGPIRELQPGSHCLLRVMRRHFWVKIDAVYEDGVRTSFPATDYPVPGMQVEIELHEPEGYTSYVTDVLAGPAESGGGLLLKTPEEGVYHQHRGRIRVRTDLTVHLRDQVHIRQYTAPVLNISTGGALIQTDGPFYVGDTLEVYLSLPHETRHLILGNVAHVFDPDGKGTQKPLIGLRFNDLDPSAEKALTRYVYHKLQESRPNEEP